MVLGAKIEPESSQGDRTTPWMPEKECIAYSSMSGLEQVPGMNISRVCGSCASGETVKISRLLKKRLPTAARSIRVVAFPAVFQAIHLPLPHT